MSIAEGIRGHYGLFGFKGLVLAATARVLRKPAEISVAVSGMAHPIVLRLRTSDLSVFADILLKGEYDWPFPRPPRVIVDAGANIGMASIFFASKYPEARVLAIEPEERNYRILEKNTKPYRNITAVCGALWSSNEPICLSDPGAGTWGFQTHGRGAGSTDTGGQVLGITVDRLMRDHKVDYIDVLKMDIEGSEREVCEGSSDWMNRVGVVMAELHDELRPGCSKAVFLAAKDFSQKFQWGETVVLLREDYMAGSIDQATVLATRSAAISNLAKPRTRIKVLSWSTSPTRD